MEYLSAHRIKVTGKFTIQKIRDIKISAKTNEHPTIYVKGIIPADIGMEEIQNKCFKEPVKVVELDENGEEKEYGIFEGIILNTKVNQEGKFYEIEINGISSSYLFDIEKKKRSFQNVSMTYAQVIKEAIGSNQVICTIGQDRKIGIPLIQYNETDWEFARRLASHFNKPIQSDIVTGNPRIWFGVRLHNQKQKQYERIFETNTYNVCISSKYYEVGTKLGLSKIYYITYKIKDGRNFHIGDKVLFQDKKLIICEKEVKFEKGELVFYYTLAREEYVNVVEYYNQLFTGLTLLGEVIKTSSEKVWLKLDVDGKNGEYDYKWKPTSGSLMYCMPKIGTKASLYFESADERSGIATNSPRTNGGNDEKSDLDFEGFSNVQNRGMVTEHNKRMDMYPSIMRFSGTSNTDIPLEILFDDENGLKFESNKILDIVSLEEIKIESNKSIIGYTPLEVKILRTAKLIEEKLMSIIPKGTYIMSKVLNDKKALVDLSAVYSNNGTTLTISNQFDIYSYKNHLLQGRNYETYPPFDDAPEEAGFDWGKLFLNVLGGIAIAGLCAVAVGFGIGLVIGAIGAGVASIGASIIGGTLASGTVLSIIGTSISAGASAGMVYGTFSVLNKAIEDVSIQENSEFGEYLEEAVYNSFSEGIANSATSLGSVIGIVGLNKVPNSRLLKPENYKMQKEIIGYFVSTSIADEIKEFFGMEIEEEELGKRYVKDKMDKEEIFKSIIDNLLSNIINKYIRLGE